jgi:hypothetical protein
VVYHSPVHCQAFFRCRKDSAWETASVALHGAGLIGGASLCHVSIDGLHLRPMFHAHTNFRGHVPQLNMPNFRVLASSSELETVRQFSDTHFFDDVGHQEQTQPSMADLTALYQTGREECSTWLEWFFPSMSALVTIFLVYIMYILLTPFRKFFHQPWHFCIRWK